MNNASNLAVVPSSKAKKADAKPVEPEHQDVLVTLAGMLPKFRAEVAAADAELSAINDREPPRFAPRVAPKLGSIGPQYVSEPPPHELEAMRNFQSRQRVDAGAVKERLKACREREEASLFAGQCLALRAAISAAAPEIEARILERMGAVNCEQAKVRDAIKATSDLRARRDALQVQRNGVSSLQGDVESAQARLASASDAGDDAGAEEAARQIARLRRQQVDTIEPLDLRLQAAQDALKRAETQQAQAEEPLAEALKALRRAEIDRLSLAHDKAASDLRDRAIELAVAGQYDRYTPSNYVIGLAPEVLQHLRSQRQDISASLILSRAAERCSALEFARAAEA